MNNSNNFFQLVAEFQKNIDWLNQIMKGGESDSINIDGVIKPAISKDIFDQFDRLSIMVRERKAYKTYSELSASGAPSEPVLAEVWRDSELAKNGIYGWDGAQWLKSGIDPSVESDRKIGELLPANGIVSHLGGNDLTPLIVDDADRGVLAVDQLGRLAAILSPQTLSREGIEQESSNNDIPVVFTEDKKPLMTFDEQSGAANLNPSPSLSLSVLKEIGYEVTRGANKEWAYAIADQYGRIAFGVRHDGTVYPAPVDSNDNVIYAAKYGMSSANSAAKNGDILRGVIGDASSFDVIRLPSGLVPVDYFSINKPLTVDGYGKRATRLQSGYNGAVCSVVSDDVSLGDFYLLGDNSAPSQIGFDVTSSKEIDLISLAAANFKHSGFAYRQSVAFAGNRMSQCDAFRCGYGFLGDTRGEYITLDNCNLSYNTIGASVKGGNVIINAPQCNNNGTGIELLGGSNDSHGVITGGNVNHNAKALVVNDIANGHTINGTHFYYGSIELISCIGLLLSGCTLSSNDVFFDSTTSTRIENGKIGVDVTVTNNANGSVGHGIWSGNKDYNGNDWQPA
ncbi:hypothetical protein ACPV4X_25280 [Vibrio owensii]|uniref:hypothetical protein n=1 Tax=Vibrio owensii TaxID=696485 RepID=UPI0040685ABC